VNHRCQRSECEICICVATVWFVALCCIETFVKPHTKAFVLVYAEYSTLSMAECCVCINTQTEREKDSGEADCNARGIGYVLHSSGREVAATCWT
jgi:hypothetical protein